MSQIWLHGLGDAEGFDSMEEDDALCLTDDLHVEQGNGGPFAAAIRATRMPLIITDPRKPDNPIIFANEAFLGLTGYARSDVMGRNCRFLQGPGTDREAVARIHTAVEQGTDVSLDLLNYRKNGTMFWNALCISPVRDESGDINYFFASQLDVTDRMDAHLRVQSEKDRFEAEVTRRTVELEDALAAKTLLLHEVDHRVKNNLQMIASLIILQSRRISDPVVRQSLMSMLERVEALASVHRRLYQSEDVTRFDVAAFARDLATELVAMTGRTDIEVQFDLEPIAIPAEKAAPVALIFNELFINALRHAFVGERAGTIRLSAKCGGDGFDLEVVDDGVGMAGAPTNSFGRTLVQALGRQLQAEVAWHDGRPGTRVHAHVPVANLQ